MPYILLLALPLFAIEEEEKKPLPIPTEEEQEQKHGDDIAERNNRYRKELNYYNLYYKNRRRVDQRERGCYYYYQYPSGGCWQDPQNPSCYYPNYYPLLASATTESSSSIKYFIIFLAVSKNSRGKTSYASAICCSSIPAYHCEGCKNAQKASNKNLDKYVARRTPVEETKKRKFCCVGVCFDACLYKNFLFFSSEKKASHVYSSICIPFYIYEVLARKFQKSMWKNPQPLTRPRKIFLLHAGIASKWAKRIAARHLKQD